ARQSTATVHFFGHVPDEVLGALYGSADVFAMLCRNRWMGLEQEGFGIVFLEAAACGVPTVAGDSGGGADAVTDGETGFVVVQPSDPAAVAAALARQLMDDMIRHTHDLAHNFSSLDLSGDNLPTVLKELAQNVTKIFSIGCGFTTKGKIPHLPENTQVQLYKI